MDWQAIDGDNSLQGVFLADPGIKATIKGTLGVDDIWKTRCKAIKSALKKHMFVFLVQMV